VKNRTTIILLIILLLLIYVPVLGYVYTGVGVKVPIWLVQIMVLPLGLLFWASPIIIIAVIVFKLWTGDALSS
jgi:hypothetical protein